MHQPVRPICDLHKQYPNLRMKFIGATEVRGAETPFGPTMQAFHENTYQCIVTGCTRFFSDDVGYFSVPSGDVSAPHQCECQPNRYTLMCIVELIANRKTVTWACLRCRSQVHVPIEES